MKPKLITTVYAADGEPIKEFAEQRRIEVPFDEIPDILIKAIIATEDNRFFSHPASITGGSSGPSRTICRGSSGARGPRARARSPSSSPATSSFTRR